MFSPMKVLELLALILDKGIHPVCDDDVVVCLSIKGKHSAAAECGLHVHRIIADCYNSI